MCVSCTIVIDFAVTLLCVSVDSYHCWSDNLLHSPSNSAHLYLCESGQENVQDE